MGRVKELLGLQNELKTKSEIRMLKREHQLRDEIESMGNMISTKLKKSLKERHVEEKQIAT